MIGNWLRILSTALGLVLAVTATSAFSNPESASAFSVQCSSAGIDCIKSTGYRGRSAWGYPVDSRGNNCTNYAAFRLSQNGARNPGNLGNAMSWAKNARSKGFSVNRTPAAGAIAQWNMGSGYTRGRNDFGHVAYVESVSGSTIKLSDSNYERGSKRWTVSKGDRQWPSNFIHIKDLKPLIKVIKVAAVQDNPTRVAPGTSFATGYDIRYSGKFDNKRLVLRPETPKNVKRYTNRDGDWHGAAVKGNPTLGRYRGTTTIPRATKPGTIPLRWAVVDKTRDKKIGELGYRIIVESTNPGEPKPPAAEPINVCGSIAGGCPAGSGHRSLGDFDGDGYDDLAIGVPGEDIGSVANAGAVNVTFGSSEGLDRSRAKVYYQEGAGGLSGNSEAGDLVGASLVAGDFDNDGKDDLAVGAPGESIGSAANAGAVNVIYGGSTGLDTTRSVVLGQGSGGLAGNDEAGDVVGRSVTVGDFDNDGFDDLAIGGPGEDIGSVSNAGAVNVIFGGVSGLNTSHSIILNQGGGGLAGNDEASDLVGTSVEAGDIDGDGYSDLAVGAPGEDIGTLNSAGAVNVIFGSASGLNTSRSTILTQGGGGLIGNNEAGDLVGTALSIGDFDGDGRADLAAGAPGENVGSISNAGAVNVVFGSSAGLSTERSLIYTQGMASLAGVAAAGDLVGAALTSGDFNGDGKQDLAIGAPGESMVTTKAGAVNVILGSASGLDASQSLIYNQGGGGLAGSAERGDIVGATAAAGDIDNDGRDDLTTGAPGEDVGADKDAGAANILFGSSTGLDTSRSLIVYQGNGLSGNPEASDFAGGGLVGVIAP